MLQLCLKTQQTLIEKVAGKIKNLIHCINTLSMSLQERLAAIRQLPFWSHATGERGSVEELSSLRASQNLESGAHAIDVSHPEELPSTVLIVDDDRAVRETICEVLRVNGYSTEDFADGLAFLKAHSINRAGVCLRKPACLQCMAFSSLRDSTARREPRARS
jgi:hypothetical protein